jgi:hypothetical protein
MTTAASLNVCLSAKSLANLIRNETEKILHSLLVNAATNAHVSLQDFSLRGLQHFKQLIEQFTNLLLKHPIPSVISVIFSALDKVRRFESRNINGSSFVLFVVNYVIESFLTISSNALTIPLQFIMLSIDSHFLLLHIKQLNTKLSFVHCISLKLNRHDFVNFHLNFFPRLFQVSHCDCATKIRFTN